MKGLNTRVLGLATLFVFLTIAYFIRDQTPYSRRDTQRTLHSWPPILGAFYPDLDFQDSRGKTHKLSEFSGRVVLVEMVGMNCPACQAWSGARERGPFQSVQPQEGLERVSSLLSQYASEVKSYPKDFVFVQILLYNMSMSSPSPQDAKEWGEHFGFREEKSEFVWVPSHSLISQETYNLIPGFQLIDRDFKLRYDSTGHHPRHNLYTELLPSVGKLLKASEKQQGIEEAYAAIPHQKTRYEAWQSSLQKERAISLERFFEKVDLAVKGRVDSLARLYRGEVLTQEQELKVLAGELEAVAQESDAKYARLVVEAIRAQDRFLRSFPPTVQPKDFSSYSRDPEVQAAHRKLIEAYDILMQQFPEESPHNKQAFFDHLCALDFL